MAHFLIKTLILNLRHFVTFFVVALQAYINRGDVLIKMGRPDEAKTTYETALTFDANNADLHYNIGVVHIERGQADKAMQDFDRALQVSLPILATQFFSKKWANRGLFFVYFPSFHNAATNIARI